jgi:hypothetical protein
MKYVVSGIAIKVALVLIVVSCSLNWSFWHGQGRTPWEGILLGAVAVCFDVFKSVLPVLVRWAITARRYLEASVGVVMFVLLFIAALVSAVGFFSGSRGGVAASQETKNERLALATAEASELKLRLASYPKLDTALKISADMAAMRTHRRWTSTKQCTDITATASRKFCGRYEGLRGDHATAVARDRAAQSLASVRGEIKRLRIAGAGKDANPQAAMISRVVSFVMPIERADANFGIVVLFASLVELGAALGLYLSVSHWPTRDHARRPATEKPRVVAATRIDRENAVTLLPPPIEVTSLPTIEQHEAFKAWKESA